MGGGGRGERKVKGRKVWRESVCEVDGEGTERRHEESAWRPDTD